MKCGNLLCIPRNRGLRDAFPFEKVWFSGCFAVHGMWSSDLPGSKSSSSSSKKKLKALGEKVQEDLGSNHWGMNSESFQLSKLLVSRWLPRKLANVLWKLMVGRCISYRKQSLFRGRVLISGGVLLLILLGLWCRKVLWHPSIFAQAQGGWRGPATVRCAVKLLSMVKMMGLQPAYLGLQMMVGTHFANHL